MNCKKVLVVDDDRVFVRAISAKLRNSGFEVITAQDGAGAVSALRQAKPDLILLDILFPPDVAHGGGVCWDGFLIMDWLRRIGGIEETPVLLMSGTDVNGYAERAKKAGARGLVPKTLEPEELMGIIQRLLDKPAVAA